MSFDSAASSSPNGSETAHPATDRALLSARGITVRFGGVIAVDDVSFEMSAGAVTGLLGPNGAGKTTLMDALSGMRQPTSGRVIFDGIDVSSHSATSLARAGIRRTFQRHQAFGWLSVEENLLVPLEWHGRTRNVLGDLLGTPGRRRKERDLRRRVDETVELCGLADVRNLPAASLPIGQVRLLEFARAIVERPRLLLLDEPTSGLGPSESEALASIIRGLVMESEDSCAVLLVEHDTDFIMDICSRILFLDQGRLVCDGTPEEIRDNPAVIEAYLGVAE